MRICLQQHTSTTDSKAGSPNETMLSFPYGDWDVHFKAGDTEMPAGSFASRCTARGGAPRTWAGCQKFLAAGGVITTLGNATTLPTDFGLVRNINASRPSGNFYAPRPIVEGEVTHPEHPVF